MNVQSVVEGEAKAWSRASRKVTGLAPSLCVLLACLVARGAAAEPIGAGARLEVTPLDRPGARPDRAPIAERTRAFENARALNPASGGGPELAVQLERSLASARRALGPEPGWWQRLALPLRPPAAERERLQAAQAAAQQAAALLARQGRDAREHLLALEQVLARQRGREEAAARVRTEREHLDARLAATGGRLAALAEDLVLAQGGLGQRLSHCWRRLTWRDASTELRRIEVTLRGWGALRLPPVLSADLTYVQGALQPARLPTVEITPAYLAPDASAPALEDTTTGREVELSADVISKARDLETAEAAYGFVKNQLKLDWYYGALKGSAETLREARGNDADLSALLVALLRAQGTAARFVRGTIELPLWRMAALMGLLAAADADAAQAAEGTYALPGAARDQVLTALTSAGIPFEPVVSGGQVTAVRFVHTWVEAFIPYARYRGTGMAGAIRQWVPMDPAVTGAVKNAASSPSLDVWQEAGLSASVMMQEYLAQPTPQSPLEFVRTRVEAYLGSSGAGVQYADVLRTVAQRSEEIAFIPGSLPYRVVSVNEETAFLPDDFKHRVRFVASDSSGAFLETTLPLHQLVGHRTLFTYRPATDADADLIAQAGGLYQAPAAAVELVAVIRVDGEEKAAARRAVGLGAEHAWSMELLLPGGSARRVDNRIIAGNLVAVGFAGPTNGHADDASPLGVDGPAPRFLYARAAAYANAWTEAEEELGQLLRVVPVRPTANLVLVENQLAVDEVLGVRRRVAWKGLEVDADHRSMTPLDLVAGRGKQLLQLSGYQGSLLEAKVLTDGTGEGAVSAVTAIQEAHARGVAVLTLDKNNASSSLPLLATTPEVVRDVQDQLAAGRQVIIPSTDLAIQAWTGTGFIARAPGTEEGGYFLSGHLSGAQTVASPDAWKDATLAQQLQQPDAPPATPDTTLVARIIKLPSTDLQSVVVGNELPRNLVVFVTTSAGVAVQGAQVTFRAMGGAKPTFRVPGSSSEVTGSVTVTTDSTGRAAVAVSPDTLIGNSFIEQPGSPSNQTVGLNVISAETLDAAGTRIVLAEPFREVGLPDVPAKIVLQSNTQFRVPFQMILGEDLPATVTDRWGNKLANQLVTWTQSPATGRFILPSRRSASHVEQLDPSDPDQVAVLQQVTDEMGTVVANFINGGTNVVTASCGGASASYTVEGVESDSWRYVFGWVPSARNSFDGIFGSSFPEPYVFQVLRRNTGSGPAWVPLRGDEPGIGGVAVHMTVSDGSMVWDRRSATPSTVGAGATDGIDTDTNVVFWPRYELLDRAEQITFDAEVTLADGTRDCCSIPITFTPFSSTVPIETQRVLPGRIYAPTGPNHSLSPGDVALDFGVTNRAAYPLYLRIVQIPNSPGEALVATPQPGQTPYPEWPDLVRIPEYARSDLSLDLVAGSRGGKVILHVLAPDPAIGATSLVEVATSQIAIPAVGANILGPDELRAKVLIPVRNFESTATPVTGTSPATATADPLLIPAKLDFVAPGPGRLLVSLGGTLLSAADVGRTDTGAIAVAAVPNMPPPPEIAPSGALRLWVYPVGVGNETVKIQVTPSDATAGETKEIPFLVEYVDAGALPVGHTFVKDVSTVDGHLVKQSEDLSLPGRAGGLRLQRSYTSRGFEASPLGAGWTHSYRSYVIPDPQTVLGNGSGQASGSEYVVVGGDGGGQAFRCTAARSCTPQRGYHGTLTVQSGSAGAGEEVTFTSKSGVAYHYSGLNTEAWPYRYPLRSITYPDGQQIDLEYFGPEFDYEVSRVFEPGHQRYLEFRYARPAGAKRAQLASVTLTRAASLPDQPGTSLGVCVSYAYDPATQNLLKASRHDGDCDLGPVARSESYTYVQSELEPLKKHLASYTDPNGVTTTYDYYSASDPMPGEGQFLLMGDKQERVRRVNGPQPGRATTFTYSLEPATISVSGAARLAYATKVKSPRADVPANATTVYWMDPYGAASQVERPIDAQLSAVSKTVWDSNHELPASEEDPRGRRTTYAYDARGNLIERRVLVPVLAASGAGGATVAPDDGVGTTISSVVERWSYDAQFGGVTCHVDPAGRVTVTTYDSGTTGTGRLLGVYRYATPLASTVLSAGGSCDELASRAGASAADVVTRWSYCGVNAGCPDSSFVRGDLVSTTDGEGNVSRVLAYDRYGDATREQVSPAPGSVVTTILGYDPRSRLVTQTDSLGHSLSRSYDALDRVVYEKRDNTKGNSPPLEKSYAFWPGGQPRLETNGFGLSRVTSLDGLGRPSLVVETGPGLPQAGVTTAFSFDEAGNRTDVIDRRGVRTHTEYDWADRPIRVTVSIADPTTFTAQGGDPADLQVSRLTATYGYDAVGNKVFETDLHGHRTDYQLDSLYRVVGVQGPPVPARSGIGLVRYTTSRRFDVVGNKTYEADGNGNATTWTYDFADRVATVVDAVGRVERTAYDRNGNVHVLAQEAPEGVAHLTRTTTYDGLNRPRTTTEVVATLAGTVTYRQQTAYDDANHTVAISDRRGYVTTRSLDDVDRVYQEIVDDGSGLIARPADGTVPLGLVTRAQYDAAGNRSLTIDPLGRQTQELHDALGRTIRRELPMGVWEAAQLDGEGHVTARTDRRGIVRNTTYDALGRPTRENLIESISSGGAPLRTLLRTYIDEPGLDGKTQVAEVDARGDITWRYLDGLHREVEVRDALGKSVLTRWDAVNRRAVTDRKGYVAEYDLDAANRPVAQRDVRDGVVVYSQSTSYDDGARTETATDRRGIPLVRERDGMGRIEQEVRGSGGEVRTESSSYDGNGNVIAKVDGNGHRTEWEYDGGNRRTKETRGAGTTAAAATTYTYDKAGNRLTTKGPRGAWAFDLRESYDDLNRGVRSEDALGNVTTRAFDGAGNKVCEKRPLGGDALGVDGARGMSLEAVQGAACTGGYVTRWAYEEESKLASVTDANGSVYTFVYDESRNLLSKQDGNGSLTTYAYDALNRRTDEWQHRDRHERLVTRAAVSAVHGEDPAPADDPAAERGTLHWSGTYDENGNPRTQTDPRLLVTTYTYGLLDRRERTEYQANVPVELPYTSAITEEWNGNGAVEHRREEKHTAAGVVTETTDRVFDGLDRLRSETRYDGKVVGYEYDAKGNRTRVTDPDGVETSYTYDALDRLATATTPAGVASYGYWPDGLAKGSSYPNGLREGRCYDAARRLTTIVTAVGAIDETCGASVPVVSRFDYGYDGDGNRTRQVEQRREPGASALGPEELTTYGYDALDRLVGVLYSGGRAELYRLDAVGNRTGERELTGVVSGSDLTRFDPIPAGATLTRDVTASFNRADWVYARTDAVDATQSATFGYDAAGNLILRQKGTLTRRLRWSSRDTLTAVVDNGVEVGRYDYDGDLQRVKRKTAQEDVEYVLDDRHVLQEASASTGHPAYRRYHYAHEPLAVDDGAGRRFISTDALGSATDLTSTTGAVAAGHRYDAWGQYRNGTAPASSEPKLGFTGHQFDPETGLVYARARYYDAEIGAFVSRDSLEGTYIDAPSLHRYMYVRSNPLRYTDPSGHGVLEDILKFFLDISAPPFPSQSPQFRKAAEANRLVLKSTDEAIDGANEGAAIGAGMAVVCTLGPEACAALFGAGLLTSGQPSLQAISFGECDPANPGASVGGCSAQVTALTVGAGLAAGGVEPGTSPVRTTRPRPVVTVVVEAATKPETKLVKAPELGKTAPAPQEPAPARPASGSVGAARAGDLADPPASASVRAATSVETGARQVLNSATVEGWEAAEEAYNGIRADTADVSAIAQNSGMSEAEVARIKDHVFFKEHELDLGVRQFDADPDIVNAWSRLKAGDFVQSDLDLLQHEYFESRFESLFKTNYTQAHGATLRSGRTWKPE
ncbi:RHS repeat-associated core domain-containing protein [Anaeromyxobacter oryzisoli]|uniref:RHS repeat-associated core domain-containing protein n=1 Tax=Anaeromyxobacter oryzisoli TaxID=2925408 RepID=UPI001F57BE6F|nr:RHS repeat-associated core domain-containing protein [Anaeromyxobacter sp. SG63]